MTPRPRNRKDAALPQYVQRRPSQNRVIWREYLGRGKFGKVVTLRDESGKALPADANQRAILTAYNAIVAKPTGHTLGDLLDRYLKSAQFSTRADKTRRGYLIHAQTIRGFRTRNGRTLGQAPLAALTPPIFSRYRDKRSETAPASANREIQFIRAVFSWGIEYGHCDSNPARSVRLNEMKPRDRYIEDWEMEAVQVQGSDMLAVAIELAYLCRARVGEVLDLRRSDLTEKGVLVRRTKGSKSEVTLWSPRLEDAVKAAKAINGGVLSPYLLHGKDGDAIKYAAVRSAFVRALSKAMAPGQKIPVEKPFTLHDVKAKGITDHKHNHGGHRSERMRDVYIRKAQEVESTR